MLTSDEFPGVEGLLEGLWGGPRSGIRWEDPYTVHPCSGVSFTLGLIPSLSLLVFMQGKGAASKAVFRNLFQRADADIKLFLSAHLPPTTKGIISTLKVLLF